MARLLAARDPESITVEQRKEKRRGRLFVDIMRNAYAQMVVAPVSTVHWLEAEDLPETDRGAGGFGSTGVVKV